MMDKMELCECNIIHGDVVERVRRQMPDETPV